MDDEGLNILRTLAGQTEILYDIWTDRARCMYCDAELVFQYGIPANITPSPHRANCPITAARAYLVKMAEREAALTELAQLSQDMGLYK